MEAARRAALRAWKLRHTRVKDELNALVDLGIRRTPAQLRRMVELAEELEVINASRPGPSSASSSRKRGGRC